MFFEIPVYNNLSVQRTTHMRLSDLPIEFHPSDYYQTLHQNTDNRHERENENEFQTPPECTRTDFFIHTREDLAHMLRTVLFWGFPHTPESVWSYFLSRQKETESNDAFDITDLLTLVPDLEKTPFYVR